MNEDNKSALSKYISRLAKPFSPVFETFGTTERMVFIVAILIAMGSALMVIGNISEYFMVEIPTLGGTLQEGIVGIPRFINPLLASSDADRDMTELVYSGLLRVDENGNLIPDLASKYEISENGLEYTVTLKEGIYFHDGTPITADDIVFTVQKAQDSIIKSPKRATWEDVKIEKISDNQVKFVLKNQYAPFLVNLTMGILPKHIWKSIDSEQFPFSQFNIEPIGSGPYKVSNIKRNSGGLLVYYELEPFNRFALGKPHIEKIIVRFYSNEKNMTEAYNRGDISDMNSISPFTAENIKSKTNIVETPLPRVYAVFFNQNQNQVLANKEVRQALDIATDRERIISEILSGYGQPIYGPIPPGLANGLGEITREEATSTEARIAEAKAILTKAGWKLNSDGVMEKKNLKSPKKAPQVLSFTISTNNISSDLLNTAKLLKEMWEKIGAKVEIKVYEGSDLYQASIRPRKFDALLFGEVINRDLDFFAYWHSSQRNDPGYNVAMYTNSTVDKLLDDARKTQNFETRVEKYKKFETEIVKDIPAIFLYSPDFIYVLPKEVKGVTVSHVTTSAERFSQIYKWFIETDKVWGIFAKY